MDSAAYAAMRGLVRGLVKQRIINGPDQVRTIAAEIRREAEHYRQIGHSDKVDAITDLADAIQKDAGL